MDWVVKKTFWPLMSPELQNMTLLKPSLVWVRYLPTCNYYEIVISIEWQAELPKIMMYTHFWNSTNGRHTLTLHGPFHVIWCYLPLFLVWVSMPTYKHNQLKQIRGSVTQYYVWKYKCIKMSGFWHKEDICWPLMPPSLECDATHPYSGLIQHAYLTN